MRESFVQLVKDHINSKPDYKDTLKEIKANLLTMGVTEEEFEEALKQVGAPLESYEEKKPPEVKPEEKKVVPKIIEPKIEPPRVVLHKEKAYQGVTLPKLIKFDLAANLVVLVIIAAAFGLFIVRPVLLDKLNFAKQSQNTVVSQTTSPEQFIKPVYANEQEVDAAKIFSFKPSQVTLSAVGTPRKEVYGYFPYWMLAEHQKISLNALTKIGLFGLETDGGGNIIANRNSQVDPGWVMWNDPELDKFIRRAKTRRIKVELVVKAFDNTNIERLVASDKAQQVFIANVIHALNTKSLNGVNLDFEYVGTPSKETTDGFTRLITNLRSELIRQLPNSTLTLSSYVNAAAVPKLLDVEALADKIDAFVIMAYDVHTPSGSPGPIAPIEGELSINGYLQSYLDKVEPEKLILAVPYYGYDWPVPNVSGKDDVRILPYAEIAEISKNSTILWDDISQTPYYKYTDSSTENTREVHFENARSLGVKYDYVTRKNLRGIGIWALGYDGLNSDLRALILEKF